MRILGFDQIFNVFDNFFNVSTNKNVLNQLSQASLGLRLFAPPFSTKKRTTSFSLNHFTTIFHEPKIFSYVNNFDGMLDKMPL